MVPLFMFQRCYEKLQKRYDLRDDGKDLLNEERRKGIPAQGKSMSKERSA